MGAVFKVQDYNLEDTYQHGSFLVTDDGNWAKDLEAPDGPPYNGVWPIGDARAAVYYLGELKAENPFEFTNDM